MLGEFGVIVVCSGWSRGRVVTGPGMLGEFGVIVVCSGWLGGKAVNGPGRSARGR